MPNYLVELDDGRKFRVEAEAPPTSEEILTYLQAPPAAPAANQPGRLGSFASNVGRGALSVIPGTVGGVGYALGSDTLTGAADTIEGGINRMLPVNPEYQDELLMKGGQAVGQAIGMLGTGGAVGAAGKSLALSRGLAQGAAAAKGADLARNVMLGTGIAQGTRGGGQAAEQYGMQGGAAYARALLGGAIEGATERYLFGMGTELAPVKKFLGEAAEKGVGGIVKSISTEAGEEAVSQIGGNVATSVLAPYGVQTPGVLEGVGESALLGGIAGGTIGGIGALMQPSPTIEGDALVPPEQAPPPVEEPEDDYGVAAFQQQMTEIAAQPDPIAPIQQTVTAAAENSVRVNANVLPATAAVIEAGGLAPAPTVEQPAPVVEQPAPVVEQPRTREEEIAQMRARLRLNLSAEEREDMEQQLAQAQDEGVLADVFAEERRKAAQRDDFLRRQQDLENERQRLADEGILGDVFAEERQRATAREQQRQQPPVVEETVAPIQPVPAVEETGAPVETKGKKSKTKPKTVEQAQARIEEQQAASEFVSELRAEKAQEELRNKKGKFISDNAADNKESTFLSDLLKGGWDKSLDDVQAGRVTPQRAATLAQAAADAGLIDTFTAKRFTPEQVPNVENVIDEPGAAEVGLGMEKLNSDFDTLFQLPPAQKRNLSSMREKVIAKMDEIEALPYDSKLTDARDKAFKALEKLLLDIDTERLSQARGNAPRQPERYSGPSWSDGRPTVAEAEAYLTEQLGPELQTGIKGNDPEGWWRSIEDEVRAGTPRNRAIVEAAMDYQKIKSDEARQEAILAEEKAKEATSAPAPTVQRDVTKPEQMTPEVGSVEAKQQVKDRRDSIPAEDLADYDEFMSLLERRGPAQSKVKGFSFTKTDEKRFQELGKKLRKYLFETVSPATDPVIWKDISGHDIHMSAKRTFYTVENGRVRTGVAFESERFIKDFNPKPIPAEFVEKADAVDFLPEGYVRQGDLYVFQPSGTVEVVTEEKAPAKPAPQPKPTAEVEKKSRALPVFTPSAKEPFKPSSERFAQFYIDDGFPEATATKNGAKLMQAVETGEWTDLLHPDNKKSRVIWDTWTRQKLPKGLAASKAAFAEFVADYRAKTFTTPASELADTDLDTEILRLAEQGIKPTASQRLKDRALELSKEFQKRQEVAATDKAEGEASARKKTIAKKALAATGGRGTVGNLAGDSLAQVRADLLSEITGTKVPKSKAGINALMKAFYQEFGIDADTEAGMQKKLAQTLQDAVTETAPQPKPAEAELAQVGDEVTWMAAGRDARGTVYAVRGDSADIDYFGPKTVPLSELSIVRKSVRRLAQEKRDAEAAASTTQKKTQEPEQPKSKFTKAEVASLEQGKTPEGWTLSVGEPVTVTDTKGKKWQVKIQYSPTRTMTLVSGGEIQTFDVQIAPQPKPAAEGGTGVAGVPAEKTELPAIERRKIDAVFERILKRKSTIPVANGIFQIPYAVALKYPSLRFIDWNERSLRYRTSTKGEVTGDFNAQDSRDILIFDNSMLGARAAQRTRPQENFGSANTVVTKAAKDQAAKSLRESLGQTNVGLNPATLKYAIIVGTYYLEGGVRSFADFSAKMVEEFGEGVRKYLQPAYEALRKRTDIDTTGMDPVEGVETAPVVEAPTAPAPAPAVKVEAEAPRAAPTQAASKPAAVAEPDVVGIANARVKAQRERLNLEELNALVGEAYSFPQMWADSESALKADPTRGSALVKELNKKPRSLKPLEVAILLREEVVRTNALNQAMEAFNAAPSGNNEVERQRMDEAVVALTEVDNAAKVSGTEQGRALNARKLLAKLDYTLPKMLTTLSAANNGSLKDGDLEMVTRLQKRLKDVQDQLAEVESGQAARLAETEKIAFEAGRQEVLKDIEERAKNEAERVAEMQKRKAEYLAAKKEAAKTPSKWEEIRAAARARNAELRSNLYSDVVLVKAASMAVNDVIIGATYIAEGVTKFADWVSKMRSEDINLTDDEMQQLFKESKAFDAGEDLPASEAPLKVKKAKAPAIDKVKAIAADEEALDSRTVYNLVVEKMKKRAEESKAAKLPEMSADDLTSVISEVTADVKEFFPDITEREIRDLFSGYGKILMPSKEELAKQIRQLSALGKLQSAIEDAEAKRAPLKSGPQRDKATQAIRLQQKKLARELRMMGRDYEAGEEQLRSPLDAIKARLNNQIDDLAMEINTRKKAPRRPSVDYDKDTQELADLRDELKRISDFINAPAGPTFTELVNEEMKKIDARIAELQKTLAEGKFSPKEDTALYSQELQVKRDERDRLSKLVAEARKKAVGDTRTQDEIDRVAVSEAKKAIAELERKIADKDLKRPESRTPTETADYKALIDEKKRLQGVLSKMRQEAEGRKGLTDEQRIKQATAAVDKSIERMQKMLTSGNYDVPKRTSKTPETPELAQKRETRDKLRKQLLELRKLKKDALIDPIAKQLKTDKKRIQTRMDKLKKRMETGDFSKPEKRKKATDDELLALQVEEENLKEAWAKIVFERQLASRGPGKRLLDAGQQTINTARAVLTSFDVSAVLRQGGFIVLGNPLRGFRNLGPMFQAFGSDKFDKEEKFRLERRENFKNGAYQQSKLFLADVNKVDQMTQQEEAFMSRWIKKLPKGAKGLYIGSAIQGSQRAYTVFLNRLRMDTFDAMVANLKKGSEPTPQEMSAVANYINIATGRGDLGKFNQAGTMLNTVFFAPRLVASRFQILAGYPYFTASGRTKALVLREYGKFFAGATLVYVIGALAQGDDDEPIETDPRSSDFLKIRFGDTRVDPLSGLIQATVLVSRLVSGEKKQASGKIVTIRGEKVPYGADDSFDVMGNFVRTKFSPIVGSAVNVVTGKNVVGEPTDIGEETKRMLIPMSFTEMKETLEAQGVPEATALIMLQLFGMGVQTYTPGKK